MIELLDRSEMNPTNFGSVLNFIRDPNNIFNGDYRLNMQSPEKILHTCQITLAMVRDQISKYENEFNSTDQNRINAHDNYYQNLASKILKLRTREQQLVAQVQKIIG